MRRIIIAPTGSQSAVRVEKIDRDARTISEVLNGGLSAENLRPASSPSGLTFSIGTFPGSVPNAITDNSNVLMVGGVYGNRFPASQPARLYFGFVPGNYRLAALNFIVMNAAADVAWDGAATLIQRPAGGAGPSTYACPVTSVSRDALGITTGAAADPYWYYAARWPVGNRAWAGAAWSQLYVEFSGTFRPKNAFGQAILQIASAV